MKTITQWFLVVAMGLALGVTACDDEAVEAEEVREAVEAVNEGGEPVEGTSAQAATTEADAGSEATAEAAQEEEPQEVPMTEQEAQLISYVSEQINILETKCARPKPCGKALNKIAAGQARKVKKIAKKLKQPSETFLRECKEVLAKRDGMIKAKKKVARFAKKLKAFDKGFKRVCK